MSQEEKFVTHTEFDPVKRAVDTLTAQVQILTIRSEVLAHDIHRLTNQVADIAEDLGELRDEMKSEFSAVRVEIAALRTDLRGENAALRTDLRGEIAALRGELTELAKLLSDGNAALLSAFMTLAPRR